MKHIAIIALAAFALCACDESSTGPAVTNTDTPELSSSSVGDIPEESSSSITQEIIDGWENTCAIGLNIILENQLPINQGEPFAETCKRLVDLVRRNLPDEGVLHCLRQVTCPDSLAPVRTTVYVPECAEEPILTTLGEQEFAECAETARTSQQFGELSNIAVCANIKGSCK